MKRALLTTCALVALVIVGVGGIEYYAKGCSPTFGTCTIPSKK